MIPIRYWIRIGACFAVTFGGAALFNPLLLIFFPLRHRLGPVLIRWLSRMFLIAAGIRLQSGPKWRLNDYRHPVLILANHVSLLDIPILSAACGTGFVSKQEVRTWPFVGPFAWLAGTLFLDRDKMARRISLLKHLATHLPIGSLTAVFPQGTTSPTSQNLPFLKGIFKVVEMNPKIRIRPVTLHYMDESTVAWQNRSFFGQALRALASPSIDVRVTVHPSIGIQDYEGKGVRGVAEKVERTVKTPLLESSTGKDG